MAAYRASLTVTLLAEERHVTNQNEGSAQQKVWRTTTGALAVPQATWLPTSRPTLAPGAHTRSQ